MAPDTPRSQRPPDSSEDLSFGALANEMEGFLPRKQEIEVPTRDFEGNEISISEQEAIRQKKEIEAKLNAKVLGASGSKAAPMWIKGVMISAVAVGVLIFLPLNQGMQSMQPMGSYVSMAIGAGAALWCLNGVMKDDAPYEKFLNMAGFAAAAVVVITAFLKMG
jgi:hypothetical protein